MGWEKHKKPTETALYLISSERPRVTGKYVFSYIAHYDADAEKWYKDDPFVDDYKPTEEITDPIIAWDQAPGAFVG